MLQRVTKKGKGGRPAWEERPGDPKRLWTVNLYESQVDWLKDRPEGGGEWLRSLLDREMKRERGRSRSGRAR